MIPEDWNARKVGDDIDLLTGFPFPSSGYSSNGVRLLRGSNVKRGETDWTDVNISTTKKQNTDARTRFVSVRREAPL